MTLFVAQAIYFGFMTIAVCVWCHSVVRAMQVDAVDEEQATNASSIFPGASPDSTVGSQMIRGDAETISRAIARVILSHGTAYNIVERTPERIVAKKTAGMSQQATAGHCTEMAFAIQQVSEDTVEVAYCFVAGYAKRFKKIALWLIFGIGLPAILMGGATVWYFCVRSQNPVARWQVLQLLQLCHALWPPFLLIHLHKSAREHTAAFATNVMMQVELSDGVEAVAE